MCLFIFQNGVKVGEKEIKALHFSYYVEKVRRKTGKEKKKLQKIERIDKKKDDGHMCVKRGLFRGAWSLGLRCRKRVFRIDVIYIRSAG